MIPAAAAAAVLLRANALCTADNSRLWGMSLCVPVMLADPNTLQAVANRDVVGATRDGTFFRLRLPAGTQVANAPFTYGGKHWAQIQWPMFGDADTQAVTLMHESFHIVQPTLGFNGNADTGSISGDAFLDTQPGRVWLRGELHALSAALRGSGTRRTQALRDALTMRLYRHALSPATADRERQLDVLEGLAEGTGIDAGLPQDRRVRYALGDIAFVEGQPSYARSFPYATGPAYTELLDAVRSDWRRRVTPSTDIALVTMRDYGLNVATPTAGQALAVLARYGGKAIEAQEAERAAHKATLDAAFTRELVEGPTLSLPLVKFHIRFNPRDIETLDRAGTVYHTVSVAAPWGALDVTGGDALVTTDFKTVRVAAPNVRSGSVIRGTGWSLRLAAGYAVVADPARGGNFTVAKSPLGLHLTSCTIGKTKVPARCGTFVVYEDRAEKSGRTIALPVVILKARRPNGRALVWNPGGPGAGATQFASFIADGRFLNEIDRLRDRYDIAFLDNRGTSGAHYQQCDLAPRRHPELYFRQIWPDSLLTACRARLARNADLSLYTTNIAADDLDDFRAAMGYPKLVLDGSSYGTYFYLVYIRRHQDRVESAILDGVAPPHILIIPMEDAYGAQLAMNLLAVSCKNDAKCNAHFPDFSAHFAALAHRFDGGPLEITIQNPVTKRLQRVALSKEVFADRLRQTLYTAGPAAYVPYIVERAYRGDYVPLGRMIDQTTQDLASILGAGLNLSVTCAEDIPFITEDAIARTSAGSFEGDARVRAQQRACKIWNVEPVSADFNQPVRSDVPVLMVSGTDDPTSPQKYGAMELPYLPNGRRALVKGASHGFETPCIDNLKTDFVLAGSAKDLNVDACGGSFARPPFATSMNGF